jgi:8-oxo-dGTP pyrophosphatase MutT (NUDIX family)
MSVPMYQIPEAVAASAALAVETGADHPSLLRLGLGGALSETDLDALVASGFGPGEKWARVTTAKLATSRAALVASVYGGSAPQSGLAILDPSYPDEDLVTWLVRDGFDGLERWRGGDAWEPVTASADGLRYALLSPELLTDCVTAFASGAGSVLLAAAWPRTFYVGPTATPGAVIAAAGAPGEGAPAPVYAIVDEFDTTAVMALIAVGAGPQAWTREAGAWKPDASVIAKLKGVDPPAVVEVDAGDVAAVVAQVDTYDQAHPAPADGAAPVTAAGIGPCPACGGDGELYEGAECGACGGTGVAEGPAPKAAGLAVVAADTGRVLMLQRGLPAAKCSCGRPAAFGYHDDDRWAHMDGSVVHGDGTAVEGIEPGPEDDDPAAGSWEFPGGRLDDGEDPMDAARREWGEETGVTAPDGEVIGQWSTPDGVYNGYVMLVGSEAALPINLDPAARAETNPDDPDGDLAETLAWWDPTHLPDNPAVRTELADTMGLVLPELTRHLVASGAMTAASPPAHTAMDSDLVAYWARGKGAAKIRWGTGGDFKRCERHLVKYLKPGQLAGACANLHKVATGTWPGPNAHGH